uniref:Nodal modulator 1 n=1 Tax=Pyxicephalus adspersus TaxID=30357 RepID=A0AAV2ZY17_PYXAD|nr:TPA: hypothetical protein GDO54_015987 [Pyxicephalus adspersus]
MGARVLWTLLCALCWDWARAADDIVVGCGGFVKSEVDINYSLIEIKLYTKQGTLKYQTDCAPNNGYFMIPLYDKGDFILKIEPPLGWSFEPTSVLLHVDGVNDICTKGEDVNFVFTGFSVNGKVLSRNQDLGPGGVQVSLRKANSGAILQTTTTQQGGKYSFNKVLPGDYEIVASHPTWTFKEATTVVQVTNSNAHASSPLIVAGYDVSGSVRSDGEPMKGVMFLLFSSTIKREDILGCNLAPIESFQNKDMLISYLCHVTSNEDGSFTFLSLPSGDYSVIPFYRGERITFDVAPSRLDFTVEHDSLRLEPVFHVMGFSVTGRVLNGPEGEGVADAVVILNNQMKVTTNADGSFRLENMTAGTYSIDAKKEHIFFDTLTVKIAPNTPQLADIIATRFSVCGDIFITHFPEGMKSMNKYKVTLTPQDKERTSVLTTESDTQGRFCFQARRGSYNIQVSVPEAELKAGLALKPAMYPVTVMDKEVMDVSFSQFMASISGKVSCLDVCGDLTVTLQSMSRQREKRSLQIHSKTESVTFNFEDILPGKYKASIIQEDWCWKNKSVEFEVTDENVVGVEFRQTGYMLRCSLSHAITLEFYQDGNGPEHVGVYNLTKGVNRFCLSKPGVYKVTPRSCHRFEHAYYTYDTSGEKITVTPSSKELLFYPPSVESVVSGGNFNYVGPLHSDLEYTIAAQKEGFVLTAVDGTIGDFNAFALAGVTFEILSEDEQPLAGVLLSLSGGMFRSNLLTQENGMLTFSNLPECVYHVQLKAEGNDHIERALPTYRAIEVGNSDIDEVNIIAFRQINQFDLSGNVITSPEYLSTLLVKLYESENLDNPIQSVSLGQSLFFHFPPLLRDGETYVVQLDSTLPKSQYDYTLPQISFSTQGYHKHITLTFNPTRKLPEQDVVQGSYLALPLTLLLLLAGYNHDKLIPLLLQLTSRLQGVRALGQTGADTGNPEDAKRLQKRQKTRRT